MKSKIREIGLVACAAVLTLALFACAPEFAGGASTKNGTSNEASDQEADISPSREQAGENPKANDKPTSQTIKDVSDEKGAYCLAQDGTVVEGGLLETRDYELGNGKVIHDMYVYGSEPLVVDRAKGDLLIAIGDILMSDEDEVDFQAPTDKYYWSGSELDASKIEEFNGVKLAKPLSNESNTGNLDLFLNQMIEPMGFKYFPNMLAECKGVIVSDRPTSFTYGFYEGTSWSEGEVTTSKPYYDYSGLDRDGSEYVAPVVRGKEGYFVIDVSNVPSGVYVYEFSNRGVFYAFELK